MDGTYQILVIEDNPGDYLIVGELLGESPADFRLTRARTFAGAVSLLGHPNEFDAVLLDLSLPDKTGLELIAAILELCSCTPVIVLTGYADLEFSIRSLSLGVADYLLKDELSKNGLYKSIAYSLQRREYIKTLRDISWMQSHIIRAPLSRIMGLIPLIEIACPGAELCEMLGYLSTSAAELDQVIRSISKRTLLPSVSA